MKQSDEQQASLTEANKDILRKRIEIEYYAQRLTFLKNLTDNKKELTDNNKKEFYNKKQFTDIGHWEKIWYDKKNQEAQLVLNELNSPITPIKGYQAIKKEPFSRKEQIARDIKQKNDAIDKKYEIWNNAPNEKTKGVHEKELSKLIKERDELIAKSDTIIAKENAKDDLKKASCELLGQTLAILTKSIINGDLTKGNQEQILQLVEQLGLQATGILLNFIPGVGPIISSIFTSFTGAFFAQDSESPVLNKLDEMSQTLDAINNKISILTKDLKQVEDNLKEQIGEEGEKIVDKVDANTRKETIISNINNLKSLWTTSISHMIKNVVSIDYIDTNKTIENDINILLKYISPEEMDYYLPTKIDFILRESLGFDIKKVIKGEFSQHGFDVSCYATKVKTLMIKHQKTSIEDYVDTLSGIITLVSDYIVLNSNIISSICSTSAIASLKLSEDIENTKSKDEKYLSKLYQLQENYACNRFNFLDYLTIQITRAITFDSESVYSLYNNLYKSNQSFTYILLKNGNKFIESIKSTLRPPQYKEHIKDLTQPWIIRNTGEDKLVIAYKDKDKDKYNYLEHSSKYTYSTQYKKTSNSTWTSYVASDQQEYRPSVYANKEVLSFEKTEAVPTYIHYHNIYNEIEKTQKDTVQNILLFSDGEKTEISPNIPLYANNKKEYMIFEEIEEGGEEYQIRLYKKEGDNYKPVKEVAKDCKSTSLTFNSKNQLFLTTPEGGEKRIFRGYAEQDNYLLKLDNEKLYLIRSRDGETLEKI